MLTTETRRNQRQGKIRAPGGGGGHGAFGCRGGVFGFRASKKCSPRRHGEKTKGKARHELTEVAEDTEGSAVVMGSSDSERQKNVHRRDAETLRRRRTRRVRLSQRGLRIQSAKGTLTTEAWRHGVKQDKAKSEFTEVAEATELTALQGFQFLEGSRPILA